MSVQLNRIEREFIFRALHEDGTRIQLRRGREKMTSRIIDFNSDRIVLSLDGIDSQTVSSLLEREEVHLYFNVRDNMMTCTSEIRKVLEDRIELSYPRDLFRDLGRNYERIPAPADLSVTFAFKGSIVELDFPRSQAYEALEDVRVSSSFDATKLSELMSTFRQKATEFATETRIVMFREREPESFEEKAICRSGACFYVPSVREGFYHESRIQEARVITEGELLVQLEESGMTRKEGTAFLRDLLRKKREKGVLSELYCPIRYLSYVIGYVYATSSEKQGTGVLSPKHVEFVYNFSRILAFSLKANGYFMNLSRVSYDRTRLVDISASGLLFCHDHEKLSAELGVASVIDLTLRLGDRVIETKGKIARHYSDDRYLYYGVQFLGMSPQNFRFLHSQLYGEDAMFVPEKEPDR